MLVPSSLLSFSDPQALNDFLHGSEKVSAGRGAIPGGGRGMGRCQAEGAAEPISSHHTPSSSVGRVTSNQERRRRNDGVTHAIKDFERK